MTSPVPRSTLAALACAAALVLASPSMAAMLNLKADRLRRHVERVEHQVNVADKERTKTLFPGQTPSAQHDSFMVPERRERIVFRLVFREFGFRQLHAGNHW